MLYACIIERLGGSGDNATYVLLLCLMCGMDTFRACMIHVHGLVHIHRGVDTFIEFFKVLKW